MSRTSWGRMSAPRSRPSTIWGWTIRSGPRRLKTTQYPQTRSSRPTRRPAPRSSRMRLSPSISAAAASPPPCGCRMSAGGPRRMRPHGWKPSGFRFPSPRLTATRPPASSSSRALRPMSSCRRTGRSPFRSATARITRRRCRSRFLSRRTPTTPNIRWSCIWTGLTSAA